MPGEDSPGIFYEVNTMSNLLKTANENLSFLLVCLAIVLALSLLSHLAERRLLPSRRTLSSTRRLTLIAIMGALAALLHLLDFSLPFLAPGFYKLDFSEVPVLFCGFLLGPSAAVACQGLKILLKLLLKGTSTAFVGDFANFAVGCTLVLPAVAVYHLRKTKASALRGLALGTVLMTAFGSIFNVLYLLPKFSQLYGLPLETILAMGSAINPHISSLSTFVLFAVAPLNLLKGAAASLLTMALYKRVEKPLLKIL